MQVEIPLRNIVLKIKSDLNLNLKLKKAQVKL